MASYCAVLVICSRGKWTTIRSISGHGKFRGWTLASVGCSVIASKKLYRTPSAVSLENADFFFYPCRPQGPVLTSDCCKELLTLTLTPFFLLFFHGTSPFFLTTVAKYCHGFEKVQPGP